MAAIAEDWQHELAPYPSWAIGKAVRWWMSSENKDRRRKPLPGDIAERAKSEMGVVKFATGSAERFRPKQAQPDEKPMTEAQRQEVADTLAIFTRRAWK